MFVVRCAALRPSRRGRPLLLTGIFSAFDQRTGARMGWSHVSTALAAAPYVQYVTIAVFALAMWSGRAVVLLVALLASDVVNPLLKMASAATLPAWLTDRPSGCGSRSGESVSCSVMPRFGVCSETRGTGFPSGHCQSMALMATFVTRTVIANPTMTRGHKAAAVASAWAVAALVIGQRMAVRCHSAPQAAAGVVLGVAAGWSAGEIADRLNMSSQRR